MTFMNDLLDAPSFTLSSLPGRILGNLSGAMKSAMSAHRNRRAARQLADCGDYLLRDIGLTRQDVQAAMLAPMGTDPIEVLDQTRRFR